MKGILVLVCAASTVLAQRALDPCFSNPCQNGATCHDEGGGDYSCQCPLGFKGKLCDEFACVDVNDTCERLAMDGDCTTYPETMQRDCRKSCNFCGVCFSVECSVNRVCNEYPTTPQGYKCDCPEGLTGQHCNESLCEPPCLHGGVCKEATLTCKCPPGFKGTTCEECVDEDPRCPQWAKDGQCDSQPRVRMAFCRYSCDNCPDKPCTKRGEFCVEGAVCTSEERCKCRSKRKGDGRIFCANEEDSVCILRGKKSELQAFGGAKANLNYPCRYRLARFVTALEGGGTGRICSFEVFGFSLVGESGYYYPAAAEVSLAIVDFANQAFQQRNFIKFDIGLGGIVSSEGHSVRWGSDTTDSWRNITFDCVYNKDRFAVLAIPQCGFRLQFRSYDQEADERHKPQSRLPAIVIAVARSRSEGPLRFTEQSVLHRFPGSLCGGTSEQGDSDQIYVDAANSLGLKDVDEALLYAALDQYLPQKSIVTGFNEVVLQDSTNCQEAGQHFNACGNHTKRAAAIRACHGLLSHKNLLLCLGSWAMETFNSCLDVFCNDHIQSCKIIRDDFRNARPLTRKRCRFPAFLRRLCRTLLD